MQHLTIGTSTSLFVQTVPVESGEGEGEENMKNAKKLTVITRDETRVDTSAAKILRTHTLAPTLAHGRAGIG